MINDIETMKERLKQENMELVLCHNDCWRENILYDKQSGQSSSWGSTRDEPKTQNLASTNAQIGVVSKSCVLVTTD